MCSALVSSITCSLPVWKSQRAEACFRVVMRQELRLVSTISWKALLQDMHGNGFVASLARAAQHYWLSTLSPELSGKRLELLKEIVPKLSRVAVLGTSTEPSTRTSVKRDGTRRRGVASEDSIPGRTRSQGY